MFKNHDRLESCPGLFKSSAPMLRKRRKEAAKILAGLRRLPVTGPLLSDDDLYDANGLPK